MIRQRLLVLGLVTAGVGWQAVVRWTGDVEAWTGAILVAAGCLAAAAGLPRGAYRRGGVLAVLAVQALATPGVTALLARWKEIPGLAALFALLARAVGVEAAARDGWVVFHAGGEAYSYLPGFAALGALSLALAFGGALAIALVLPIERAGAFLSRLAATLAAYGLVRGLLLVLARPDLPEHGLEISTWWTLVTLAPVAALVPRSLGLRAIEATRRTLRRRPVFALVAGFAWTFALGWEDPGVAKQGRVLFDDAHGPWEPTDPALEEERYGQRVSYSYSSLYRLVGWHYSVARHEAGPLTPRVLGGVDVLVVKTPSEPFSSAEVAAVERFVREGGGLFLIGDHTNLFGMTTHLNRLARPFRLAFREDDTWSLMSEAQSRWRRPLWLPHPIAAKVESFEFETSCTLVAPLGSRAPILGYGLGAEQADYSNPGFFGDLHLDPEDDFGVFPQLVTLHHGRGRVAAFSDSTPLSNFSLYFPGRRELALATIEHLNRRSTPWRHLPLAALLATTLGLVALGAHGRGGRPVLVPLALVAGAFAGTVVLHLTRPELDWPETRERVPVLVLDRAVSRLTLPSVLLVESDQDLVAMDSFLFAAQRLGYLPMVSDDWTRGLEGADAVVVVNPDRELDDEELVALRRFLHSGGRLLVVSGLLERSPATDALLGAFGLGTVVEVERRPARLAGAGAGGDVPAPAPTLSLPVLAVAGGVPVLTDPGGRAVYAEQPVGRGMVGVLVDAVAVSKHELGSRFSNEPRAEELGALETAYLVLRRVVEGPPPEASGEAS